MNPKVPSPDRAGAMASTVEQAMSRSAPLTHLSALMRDSNARFDAVRALLPPTLAPHVKPGPVDEQGWSLLASNAAVAAKLRQLQPRLEAALRDCGWQVIAIRVRISNEHGNCV